MQFVQLQGYRKYGLVHSSQVSNYISFSKDDTDEEKKAELAGCVSVGDTVYVKVGFNPPSHHACHVPCNKIFPCVAHAIPCCCSLSIRHQPDPPEDYKQDPVCSDKDTNRMFHVLHGSSRPEAYC